MMKPARPSLAAVPSRDPPPLDMAEDIYRHGRERAEDLGHWAKVHIASDRSPPVRLGQLVKRIVLGSGVRTERGGFLSERRP